MAGVVEAKLTSLARWARKPAVLPYGKYKGKRLSLVLHDTPEYLGHLLMCKAKWVRDNLSHREAQFCERCYVEHMRVQEDRWLNSILADLTWDHD